MKKSLILSACVSILGLSAFSAIADDTPTICSLATLHGTMAWGSTSTNESDTYRHSGSGMESYDGQGHFKWYEFYTDGSGTYVDSGSGTYLITSLSDTFSGVAITASCVAKVTYGPGGPPWTYFVAPDGSVYYWNNTQPGTQSIDAGHVDRIFHALLVK